MAEQSDEDLSVWSRRVLRRASVFTGLGVSLLCPGDGARAFRLLYAAFRVLDDRVDAEVPPASAPLVEEVERALAGRPGPDPVMRSLHAVLTGPFGPALAPVVNGMWAAQRFDLDRRASPGPRTEGELHAQRARIGDSYLVAVWTCSGAPGEPPAALRTLARAATGAHWLRDAAEDARLGYDNVPLGADRSAWTAARREELRDELAQGLVALRACRAPWRTRLLLRLLAWRYGRLLVR